MEKDGRRGSDLPVQVRAEQQGVTERIVRGEMEPQTEMVWEKGELVERERSEWMTDCGTEAEAGRVEPLGARAGGGRETESPGSDGGRQRKNIGEEDCGIVG